MSVRAFVKNTLVPALGAAGAAALVPAWLAFVLVPAPGWTQFFAVGFASVLCSVPAFALIGFTRDERAAVLNFLLRKIKDFYSKKKP